MAADGIQRRSYAAVDTNILLDLVEGNEQTMDALELCRARGNIDLIVTPTVVQELTRKAIDVDKKEAPKATEALVSMRKWGIHPIGVLPVGHGICECVADEIRSRGLIPEEEKNDSLILVESALADCKMLITWDKHLLKARGTSLEVLLGQKDLSPVAIVSPSEMNKLLQPPRRRL